MSKDNSNPNWKEYFRGGSQYKERKKRKSRTAETTDAIIKWLRLSGAAAWTVDVQGTVRVVKGRQIRTFSNTTRGVPDIEACYKGMYLGIEVKTGYDKQSEHQIKFENWIKEAGGVYFVAKDFDDFLDKIQLWIKYRDRPRADTSSTTKRM